MFWLELISISHAQTERGKVLSPAAFERRMAGHLPDRSLASRPSWNPCEVLKQNMLADLEPGEAKQVMSYDKCGLVDCLANTDCCKLKA